MDHPDVRIKLFLSALCKNMNAEKRNIQKYLAVVIHKNKANWRS